MFFLQIAYTFQKAEDDGKYFVDTPFFKLHTVIMKVKED